MIAVGRIIKPHSFRGLMKLKPYYPERNWFGCSVLYFREGDDWRSREVVAWKGTAERPIFGLADVASEVAARALQGTEVFLPRAQLGDESFPEDLVGLPVVTVAGVDVGKVTGVIESPAHLVFTVATAAGEQMYPLVPEWASVAADGKRITVIEMEEA